MRDHCSGVRLPQNKRILASGSSEFMRPVYMLKTSVLLAQLPEYGSLAFALQIDWQVLL